MGQPDLGEKEQATSQPPLPSTGRRCSCWASDWLPLRGPEGYWREIGQCAPLPLKVRRRGQGEGLNTEETVQDLDWPLLPTRNVLGAPASSLKP